MYLLLGKITLLLFLQTVFAYAGKSLSKYEVQTCESNMQRNYIKSGSKIRVEQEAKVNTNLIVILLAVARRVVKLYGNWE